MEKIKKAKKEGDNTAVVAKNKADSDKTIELSKELVEKAVVEGLDKNQEFASRIALAVILCTGRRNIEILKTGTFKAVSDNTIMFAGQAKKKYGATAKPYEIPVVFAKAQDVVKSIEILREKPMAIDLKGLDNEAIAKRISTTLSESARTRFKNKYATFYTARSAYAHEAYKAYRKSLKTSEKAETFNGFISGILGHEEDDISTAKSYGGVEINPKYSAKQAEKDFKKQTMEKIKSKLPTTEDEHPYINRLIELEKKLPALEESKRSLNAQLSLVQWLIAACRENAEFSMKPQMIRKKKGGRIEPIRAVLERLKKI